MEKTEEDDVPLDAANRVFNIPELLEHILIQVAARPKKSQRKPLHRLPELCQLFALRKVSVVFNATIDGSAKLLNLMHRARNIRRIDLMKKDGRALRASDVVAAYGERIEKLAYTACMLGSRQGQSWENIKFLGDKSLEAKVVCGWGRILTVKPGTTFGQVIDMVLAAGEEDMMKKPNRPGTRYPFWQRWLERESLEPSRRKSRKR